MILKGSRPEEDELVGLVSWGRECAKDGVPGVYSRISYFYDWIVETVCENFPNDAPGYMECYPTLEPSPAPSPAPSPTPTHAPTHAPTTQEFDPAYDDNFDVDCSELNATDNNITDVNCTDMNITLGNSFVNCTELNVTGGNTTGVNCTDMNMTREPTEAPTEKVKKETTFVSWQFIELGECEGHCSTDSQCKGNLICYERITIDVPGCTNPYNAGFSGIVNVCIDPAELDLPTRESTEAPTKKEKKETTFVSWQFIELGECEGHCSTDSQCKGNLICYERITIGVPGCSNPYNAGFNVDICIDPAELDP